MYLVDMFFYIFTDFGLSKGLQAGEVLNFILGYLIDITHTLLIIT